MEVATKDIEFKKYSEYKDSSTAWLGKIPANWELLRMKYLFRDVSIKNKPKEELLSVTQDKGVVPRSWVENRMVMPTGALESFKFIEEGDFAISLRSFEGGLEYCYHNGIISPAYTVLKALRDIDSGFYKYLFKSKSFISELQTSVVGIRQGKNISYPELSYSLMPIPLLEEQTAIARFLDEKTAKIDEAISIKQQQIELLKERRQILIHKAVTRGLNPDVPLKPSGVDWIGDIPEHWEVTKIGFNSTKIGDGLHGTPEYDDSGEYYFVNGNNLKNGQIVINEKTKTVGLKEYQKNIKDLREQTILLSINGTIGSVAFYSGEKIMLGKSVCYINLKRSLNIEFVRWFLESPAFKKYYQLELSGSTINNLSLHSVSKAPILLPPENEQDEISKYINSVDAKISKTIGEIDKQLQLIISYKTVLINSAVTGKIKVS